MPAVPWRRIGWEIGLGLVAALAGLVVIAPVLWLVNLIFHSTGSSGNGDFRLLGAVSGAGVLLLLYQVRVRPNLREPAMRAASGIAEALRGDEGRPRRQAAAFRVWAGVPIASLRVILYGASGAETPRLQAQLCMHVQTRSSASAALTWALSELDGDRVLLLSEPEEPGAPPEEPPVSVAAKTFDESFHHLWSAAGRAPSDKPVVFATALLAQAIEGSEAELHRLAIEAGQRVAELPDISGVEVLTSEEDGRRAPYYLWLAAGCSRAVRRQVYLALEPATSTLNHARSIDRFDLLACEQLSR
ncbi:MAG: hypothetical protein ACYDCQ_08440 [Dehalococcoidia bacterium]